MNSELLATNISDHVFITIAAVVCRWRSFQHVRVVRIPRPLSMKFIFDAFEMETLYKRTDLVRSKNTRLCTLPAENVVFGFLIKLFLKCVY